MKPPLYVFMVLALAVVTLAGCYDLTSSEPDPPPPGDLERFGVTATSEFDWSYVPPQDENFSIAEAAEGVVRITGILPPLFRCPLEVRGYVIRGDGELYFEVRGGRAYAMGCVARFTQPGSGSYEGILRDLAPGSYRVRVVHDTRDIDDPGERRQVLDTEIEVGCCYQELEFSWYSEVLPEYQTPFVALEAGDGSIAITGRAQRDPCEPVEGWAWRLDDEVRIGIRGYWHEGLAKDLTCPEGRSGIHQYEGVISDLPPGSYRVRVKGSTLPLYSESPWEILTGTIRDTVLIVR